MIAQAVVPMVVVVLASLAAVITDLRSFKVYNLLTLPMLASGLAYHTWVGGQEGLWLSVFGILVGAGVLLVPYLLGAFGGGDVKLVAAIGAWLGTAPTLWIVVFGLLAMAVYSLVALASQRRLRDAWVTLQVACYRLRVLGELVGREDQQEETEVNLRKYGRSRFVPFSVMVALGILANLLLAKALGWALL